MNAKTSNMPIDIARVSVFLSLAVGGYRSNVVAAVAPWLVVFAVIGFVFGCTSHREDATRRCTELRDHVVELRLAQSQGATDALGHPIDLAPHRAAMKQLLGDDFVEHCQRDMQASQVKCALAATDTESASACIRPSH